MMTHLHTIVAGSALALMLALLVGLVLAKAYRLASRQLSRGGMFVFLVVCGIATVKAQKREGTIVVDAAGGGDFTDLNEAVNAIPRLEYLPCTVYVKPGVYGPVMIDGDEWITEYLTWGVAIWSTGGAEKTIIEGQGATYGFGLTYDLPTAHPQVYINGFTIRNADIGVYDVIGMNCIVHDCRIGAYDAPLNQSVFYNNREYGALISDFDKIEPDFPYREIYEFWSAKNCAFVSNGVAICGTKSNVDSAIFCANGTNLVDSCSMVGCYVGDNPGFVDVANGNFKLDMGSPCINAGTARWAAMDFDLAGRPRVQRGQIDIGPYEFQPTNDAQTITAPVPVEFAWVDAKCPDVLAAAGGDYDKAVLQMSANPVDIRLPEESRSYYSIWQSYLLDLNPTDSNATWYATIKMVDGVPVVGSEPESPNRKYTNLGKHSLTDETWSATCEDPRFFRVKVELK